jgi:hypothetical protein
LLGPEFPIISGALLEAATPGVIVDAEVEDLGEMGQKAVGVAAALTEKQQLSC